MRSTRLIALAAASALLLAGCSSPSSEETSGADGELETTTVRYGTFSTGLASREVLIAEELGYFEDAGLQVEFQNVATTAALIPLLASGQLDMAYLSYQPTFSALAAGVDLTLAGHTQDLTEGIQALYVATDSDFESVADLEGKRIGVNAVGGFGDILVGEALATEGYTLDDVELVELNFSNMIGAIEQGEIDAGWLPSSFIAVADADPEERTRRLVDFSDIPSLTSLPQGGDIAAGAFQRENPNTVAAFVAAEKKAAEYLAENPEYDREQQVKIAGFPPAVGKLLGLVPYVGNVSVDDLEKVAELQKQYGQLAGDVDVEKFAASQAQ